MAVSALAFVLNVFYDPKIKQINVWAASYKISTEMSVLIKRAIRATNKSLSDFISFQNYQNKSLK